MLAVRIAGRVVNVGSLDSPCTAREDEEGMTRDGEFARKICFPGEQLIHPAQMELAHEVFSPTAGDMGKARRCLPRARRARQPVTSAKSTQGKEPVYSN